MPQKGNSPLDVKFESFLSARAIPFVVHESNKEEYLHWTPPAELAPALNDPKFVFPYGCYWWWIDCL